jgi:hypothetical protein
MVRPGVTMRKPRVKCLLPGPADGVDRLPGDEHRHDGRLAGAGGELQREPHQFRIGVIVAAAGVEQSFARLARCGATSVSQIAVSTASTWQKNGRTPPNLWCRQCWSSRAVSGVTCHWLAAGCASVDVRDLVDDRREVVLLLLRREALALVEDHLLLLLPAPFALLRLRDRRDELGAATALD